MPGRPTSLDNSRARACCPCIGEGGRFFLSFLCLLLFIRLFPLIFFLSLI